MKYLAILFLYLLYGAAIVAQPYEEFTLDSEVKTFLDKNFSDLKSWDLGVKLRNSDNQLYLDSIEYSPWHVADFNDDGLLDLFVQMYKRKENRTLLIMALEEVGTYNVLEVEPVKKVGDLHIPFVEETQEGPLIIYKQYATEQTSRTKDGVEIKYPKNFNTYYSLGFLKKDTLIYRFDRLMEYASKPNLSGFKYVQMRSYCQFGGCPDYILKVDSVGNMILQNIKNTALDPGYYKAVCDPDLFRNLQLRVKYLQLPKTEMKFGDNTADKVITMIIAFSDGRTYKVLDYSTEGTLGLKGLYDYMEEIRTTTLW